MDNDDTRYLVGEVTEVRVSPDRLKVARRIPGAFLRPNDESRWLATYFRDRVGTEVQMLTDADVSTWSSWTG